MVTKITRELIEEAMGLEICAIFFNRYLNMFHPCTPTQENVDKSRNIGRRRNTINTFITDLAVSSRCYGADIK